MQGASALRHEHVYHLFTRGNNRQDIFLEERNYAYFLNLFGRQVEPLAETFAYCLMRNHFHLLLRIRSEDAMRARLGKVVTPSQQFSNFLNAYAKGINKTYERTGSLFEHPFGRRAVTSDAYFVKLITYIHRNPQKHGFVSDFRDWPFSSYHVLTAPGLVQLRRQEVMDRYGGADAYAFAHLTDPAGPDMSALEADDFM